MITPESAKERYSFYDASDREDTLIASIIRSIQCTRQTVLISILTLLVIVALTAGLAVYQYVNGFSVILTVIPLVMIFIYLPKTQKTWEKYRHSSSIYLEKSKTKHHFLVCRGVCTKKNEVNDHVYSLKVRISNGMILDSVLTEKSLYDSIKLQENLLVTLSASGVNPQLVAIPAAFLKANEEKIPQQVAAAEYQRPVTEEELEMVRSQYRDRIKLRQKLYFRNYYLILAAGIIGAIAGFLMNLVRLLYPSLFVIVLILGALFMYQDEDRRFKKQLSSPENLKAADAYVSNIFPKTGDMEFSSITGNQVLFCAKKKEDTGRFGRNDPCLLIYAGKEQPVPFRKPASHP